MVNEVAARHTARNSGVAAAAGILLYKVPASRRLVTFLLIYALRASTLAFLAVLGKNCINLARLRGQLPLRRVLWYAVSGWSVLEGFFILYIYQCRRRLDSQGISKWQAVTAHSTEEKRTKSMERWLLSLVQVSQCNLSSNGPSSEQQQTTLKPSGLGMQSASLPKRTTSMDFAWLDQKFRSISSSGNLFGHIKSDRSENDLLKLWEGTDKVTDEELQQLKHLELAAFFSGPGRGSVEDISCWLQRDNVEQWVAHYWFRGSYPEDLARRERKELGRLVDIVLESFGLTHLPHGSNPQLKCYRLLSDPLPVAHRPLWMYAGTSIMCPLMTSQVMRLMGFERLQVGGLTYWKRGPRRDVQPADEVAGQVPLVFVHGLGVGLVPYYFFLYRLSKRHSGDFFVPEFPFLAMAPWENVPSAREVIAQIQDMLTANGHTAAHFVGHSFGAVICSWVLKMSPGSMVFMTLMDPANFLIMKSDCLCDVLYGAPQSCFEIVIQWFGFSELFTLNLLCRNIFWEQSSMWPEEIQVPCVIELAGDDHVVSSLFVRRMLEHERQARKEARKASQRKGMFPSGSAAELTAMLKGGKPRETKLEILWCEGFLHGEILLRTGTQDKLFSKIKQVRLHAENTH